MTLSDTQLRALAVFEGGMTIVRSPRSSVAKNEMKSRLDREADGILARAGYTPSVAPRQLRTSARRMSERLQQVWPQILAERSRGESVAKLSRRFRIDPHTIAYHLAVREIAA